MAERWLRWYDGTTRDGKFRIVAELVALPVCTVIGIWASILEDAATSDPRGFVTRDIEHHSMYLGIATHEIEKVWNALERVGTLRNARNAQNVQGRSGIFEVLNWGKRQYETDDKDPTAKERKAKWLETHNWDGTPRNAPERSGTPESESESESESERKSPPPKAEGHAPPSGEGNKKEEPPPGFAEFWLAYPKKVSKPAAMRAWRQAIKRAPSETIMDALRAQKPTWKDPQYIKHPSTWLNNDCWSDEVPKKPEWSLML